MGAYTKEIQSKSTEELLAELAAEGNFSPSYSRDVRKELKKRHVDVVSAGATELSVHERRQRCESCRLHSTANPLDPLSDVICTITGRAPFYEGDTCPNYDPIEDYKSEMALRAILFLILSAVSVLITVLLIRYQLRSGQSYIWIVILAPITLLGFSINSIARIYRDFRLKSGKK